MSPTWIRVGTGSELCVDARDDGVWVAFVVRVAYGDIRVGTFRGRELRRIRVPS